MKTSRQRAIILWIAGIVLGITLLAGAVVVVTSKSYFDNHQVRSNPAWVSDLFLNARKLLGHFREPPSNEEMIRYFHEHQAEFERLVHDYYAIIRQAYDKNVFPDRNALLKFQMIELGIGRVTAGGAIYPKSIYGSEPLLQIGVKFYLIDRGGSLKRYEEAGKAYAFAPPVTDQATQERPPILHYINSGQYFQSTDVPKVCERRQTLCCGLVEISANWAVTTCVNMDR